MGGWGTDPFGPGNGGDDGCESQYRHQKLSDPAGREIIDNRRGIGYFVAEKARERIMEELKTEFINDELPRLFRLMRKLDMGVEELVSLFEHYQGEDLA
jgi:DNA-binding transcriptional regulator YhcF (GntR family)